MNRRASIEHLETRWHTSTHPIDQEWKRHAACRGHDPEMWFPAREHDRRIRATTRQATRAAQAICRGCPVQADCLHHALITDTRYGIWGGATESDRARLTGRRAYG